MEYSIKRYSLNKELISEGSLVVTFDNNSTKLIYSDSEITESVEEKYHPIAALESLRKLLENEHKSLLNCNGCRIDTSYKYSGRITTFLIQQGKQATIILDMFEPTTDISKLCTIEEHKLAYRKWADDL
jgi:hypothetical protein